MGRPTKTERLEKARPIVMPSTLTFCKLNLQKLYARSRRLQLSHWNEQHDYADFIHNLWNMMLTHSSFKKDALKIEDMLGTGDVIQLLSDIVMDHQKNWSNV
ncbi:hypothetical protein [Dokdonia sp. Hel_I_53]|uniref:hypothetical protein n=1 Tax=Dokdonia sp. Hel_I_53 TaxID=1566287 RepID=UPI00119A2109|nr:hypothetical protein [Dokdonia sp. Hel_I_53]TVZ53419.1 hypothetical protein OD90_2627 [Dokdonia sp. Hel_I_53]